MAATTIVIACTLALAIAPAADTPEAPPDPYALGAAAFQAGDHAVAAEHFEDAFAETSSTATLFDWAQALRLAGRCQDAAQIYQRFLDAGGEMPQDGIAEADWATMRALAAEHVAACPPAPTIASPLPEPEVAEPPPETPEVEPVAPADAELRVVAPPAAEIAEPRDDGPPRRRPDALGISLLASGSVLAVAGAGLFIGAELEAAKAERAFLHQDQRDGLRRASAIQLSGAIVLPVGVAVAIAGATRLGVVARRNRGLALRASPSPRGVVISGRF